jgi:hypothetical protein
LKQLAPCKLAEAVMQLGPAIDGARHGDGIDPILGHLVNTLRFQVIDGQAFGSPATGIQSV